MSSVPLPEKLSSVAAESPAAELERLRREFKLRDCALDAASTYFMVVDATREGWPIVYVNRAICRDHGYEPSELIGRNSAEMLVDPESRLEKLDSINAKLLLGETVRSEILGLRKDGTKFWVGMSMTPVFDEHGGISHYLAVGADITARREQDLAKRKLQEQLVSQMQERERILIELRLAQKLESVGRLAAGVAHEINTPIQYVGDSVHFLKSSLGDYEKLLVAYRDAVARLAAGEPSETIVELLAALEARVDLPFLSAEMPKAFDRTLDGVERVAGIVRAMKEFAHPDTNEQRPADINHALETTLIVARNEYKYCAAIDCRLQPLPDVMCNIGELNQVFLNLIVNAADAIRDSGKDTETGRITITTESSQEFVSISFGDNGCGIPSENLEKIFDPFFTTKDVGKGTGQGLSITRTIIVERHGGTIDCHSTVGAGTRFVIKLPIAGRAAIERAA